MDVRKSLINIALSSGTDKCLFVVEDEAFGESGIATRGGMINAGGDSVAGVELCRGTLFGKSGMADWLVKITYRLLSSDWCC